MLPARPRLLQGKELQVTSNHWSTSYFCWVLSRVWHRLPHFMYSVRLTILRTGGEHSTTRPPSFVCFRIFTILEIRDKRFFQYFKIVMLFYLHLQHFQLFCHLVWIFIADPDETIELIYIISHAISYNTYWYVLSDSHRIWQ